MSTPEDLKTPAVDDAKLDDVSGGVFIPFIAQCDATETNPNEEPEETTDETKLGWYVMPPIK